MSTLRLLFACLIVWAGANAEPTDAGTIIYDIDVVVGTSVGGSGSDPLGLAGSLFELEYQLNTMTLCTNFR